LLKRYDKYFIIGPLSLENDYQAPSLEFSPHDYIILQRAGCGEILKWINVCLDRIILLKKIGK